MLVSFLILNEVLPKIKHQAEPSLLSSGRICGGSPLDIPGCTSHSLLPGLVFVLPFILGEFNLP